MFAALAGTVVLAAISAPHCGAMCGPLASCVASRRSGSNSRSSLHRLIRFHLGRVFGYGALGAIVGGLGAFAFGSATPWLALLVSWSVAVFLVVSAVSRWRLAVTAKPLLVLTRSSRMKRSSRLFGQLVRVFRRHLSKRPGACGSMTALLPCGVLWAALVIASSSGSAALGASSMMLFAVLTGVSVSVVSAVLAICDRRFGARPLAIVFALSAVIFLVAPLPGLAKNLSSDHDLTEPASCPFHQGQQ